jgi:lipopolysaccharide/colanic/teichoic acid biosynthesis glycosyltransferase
MPSTKLRAFALLLTELCVMLGCAWLAAAVYYLDLQFPLLLLEPESRWLMFTMALCVQAMLGAQGLYRRPLSRSRISLLLVLCQAEGMAFLAAALAGYVYPPLRVAPSLTIMFGVISLPAIFLWRLVWSLLFWRASDYQRILFLGRDAIVRQLAEHIHQRQDTGCTIVGYLDPELAPGTEIAGAKVLGPFSQLAHTVTQYRPNRIVIGTDAVYDGLPMDTLFQARLSGAVIEEAAEVYEAMFRRVSLRALTPGRLIYTKGLWSQPAGVAVQSIWVNLLALSMLVALAPLMVLIAALIRLSSRGPALEHLTCAGFEGIPFEKLSFRCARRGETGLGAYTAIGRLLERWRLESLPQLLNVVRGEMSLIGPLATKVEQAQALAGSLPCYQLRHTVKPGILGWAQLHLRQGGPAPDPALALEYDLYYIKHLSPTIDFYILLHSLVG